jgi:hypothetical protein
MSGKSRAAARVAMVDSPQGNSEPEDVVCEATFCSLIFLPGLNSPRVDAEISSSGQKRGPTDLYKHTQEDGSTQW